MSNNVQSHEDVAGGAAGEDRRAGIRHAARSLGSVTARIIGGSPVDLVNFSSRGVLFECDSRLLIGARASVRITTADANLIVTGRVVRSRVKGLIDGALRYDAALVLDAELNLTPAIVEAVRAESGTDDADPDFVADDLVSFESEFEPVTDPSPVEAYLAESEASLLDVDVSEGPLHFPGTIETAPVEADATPAAAEPPPLPVLAAAEEAVAEPAIYEPVVDELIAFEADDIAFEPAVEFAFDESGEPSFEATAEVAAPSEAPADAPAEPVVVGRADTTESAAAIAAIELAAAEETAGTSMFDATYIPPADDLAGPGESQFEVTPPTAVQDEGTSSFFDARPSETYGDAVPEPVAETPDPTPLIDVHVAIHADLVSTAGAEAVAGDTGEPVEFDTDIAFEAEDGVMFETAFDDLPAHAVPDTASAAASEPVAVALLEEALPTSDALEALPTSGAPDADVIDLTAPVPVTEDRVLLQFAATVPHDLAELQRIAADNQW